MEHHSNIVPWQLLAQRTGATLRWFDVTDEGRLDLDRAAAEGLINQRTKIISVAYVSNVLGTVNPISQIASLGHAVGATVIVDASQAVPQLPIDLSTLGADLVAFTGHKDGWTDRYRRALGTVRAPGGVAAVPRRWENDRGRDDGRLDVRAAAAPLRGGHARRSPRRSAGRAAQYLSAIGWIRSAAHEREITAYALEGLRTCPASDPRADEPWIAAAPSRSP
jgi:cysteine desulfurase/selenocysteine lyase